VDAASPSQLTFSDLSRKYPEYASAAARRQTFLAEGIMMPRGQNIDVLVDAGFYHVGKSTHFY